MSTMANGSGVVELRTEQAAVYMQRQVAAGIGVRYADARSYLTTHHGVPAPLTLEAVKQAGLRLERADLIHYGTDPRVMREKRAGDVLVQPIDEVAAAILALGWEHGQHRGVSDVFEELDGRYRHCDVYDALHDVLKSRRGPLYPHPIAFALVSEADRIEAVLEDPSATAAEVEAAEALLESHLIRRYREQHGHPDIRDEVELDGKRLRADLVDYQAREVIEAKAHARSFVGAVIQAAQYRHELNLALDERAIRFDRVVVLLPAEPHPGDVRFVNTLELNVDVVWEDGATFHRVRLT